MELLPHPPPVTFAKPIRVIHGVTQAFVPVCLMNFSMPGVADLISTEKIKNVLSPSCHSVISFAALDNFTGDLARNTWVGILTFVFIKSYEAVIVLPIRQKCILFKKKLLTISYQFYIMIVLIK